MADNIIVEPVVTDADFKGVVLVESRAFGPSPLMELVFTGTPPVVDETSQQADGFPTNLLERVEHLKSDLKKFPSARFTKATDKRTGEIVGFGGWHFFLDPENYVDPLPEVGTNAKSKELSRQFFNTLRSNQRERMGGKKYLYMSVLAVDPDHQRKGIGQKILDWGLNQADEMKLPCWIDASPFGLGLYKKNHWKEVGSYDIDLGKWGGEQGRIETTVFLVREPQSRA